MRTSESVSVLRVSLSSRPVGYLVGYQGGRNVMVFGESFRGDLNVYVHELDAVYFASSIQPVVDAHGKRQPIFIDE